ncbi:hypothetical protein [Pseudomonas sp. NPDC007930]|uniref:hypothetical protein n=1 Tax=Pseudomonas sp. NPDC007930 TaxID=3364417 RepID=UPI0036E46B20
MFNASRYLTLVRISAVYDLLVTAPFMTPWSAALYLGSFATLSEALGLARPIPVLGAAEMLFANLLGSLVAVWAVWRLRHTSLAAGRYDAAARGVFTLWQLYAVGAGASVLLLGFTLMEVAFGVLQAWPVRAAQGAARR